MSPGCIPGFFPVVAWPSEAVRGRDESSHSSNGSQTHFTGREAIRFRVFRVFRG